MNYSKNDNIAGYDDYYPFGLVMPGRSSNSANPNDHYKFTGHERDDEAGLNLDYMGARNYDPIIGRFLQIDPYAAKFPDYSPYNYTLNNPINMWDPDGRAPTGCCLDYSARYVALDRDAIAQGKDPLQHKNDYHKAQATSTATFTVGVGSLFIPGPEDVAIGILAGTKAFRAVKSLLKFGDDITSGVSDALHTGKQGKHIKGHNNFIEGNSELTGDAQGLLDNFHSGNVTSAEKINDTKTRVDFGETIGNYVDPETGEAVETTVGIIHNSKKGAHIVPARPKKIDDIEN